MWKYIKAAFQNRWNLLGLAAGVGFSFVSGQPEVGLALVGAAEIAWLGFVGTHPKFRRYVDITEQQQLQQDDAQTAAIRFRRMLTSLPRSAQRRFERLKKQCLELRQITDEYQKAHGREVSNETIAEVRLDGLDRLLWLYLKLLYTENSLNRFFETTTIDRIEDELRSVERRLERERSRPENAQRTRIIATLQDNLETCQQRQANFESARDSYELVKAEQKRLENKIRSLAEMGISRGNPEILSGEVDSVAGSVQETEQTLSELEFVTGFSTHHDEAIPELVARPKITA